MYGLPQAGILAYKRLVAHLALSGYTPVQHTPGLFRHATRPVIFSLVVDDFAIKYVDRANAEHLLATLRSLYNITTDWTASMYCGITLKWDYVARTVNLSMPGYRKSPQHLPCRTSNASPTCSARQDCPVLWLQSPAHPTG